MAKRICDICQQPIVMKQPVSLQFETNLETGTTHAWHTACKLKEKK